MSIYYLSTYTIIYTQKCLKMFLKNEARVMHELQEVFQI